MFLYIGVYYSVWFINMYVSIVNWNVIYIYRELIQNVVII